MTHQKRTEKLFSTLSRVSSTASLLDVKIEEPPLVDSQKFDDTNLAKREEDEVAGSSSSTRLLFGRPPVKALLRRSTRTALRESISYRLKSSLERRKYSIVGRYERKSKWNSYFGKSAMTRLARFQAEICSFTGYILFFIAVLLLFVSCYDTLSTVYVTTISPQSVYSQ